MSYQSPPYIKPDPDGSFYQVSQGGFSSMGGNPEPIFNRGGFSSFDGHSPSSSMIPEDDLLESLNENYPEFSAVVSQDLQSQSQFSAPQNMGVGGYLSPPNRNVPLNSGSPFDDYSNRQMYQQTPSGSGSAPRQMMPESHTQRFLNVNEYNRPQKQSGMNSVSIPNSVGSWGAGGTPESFDQTFSPPPAIKGEGADKQNLLMMEKRRRRRESHNAVERRRRDNINEKIQELASLIPEHLLEGTGFTHNNNPGSGVNVGSVGTEVSTPGGTSGTPGLSASAAAALGRDGKPNKGIILKKSVDYIRQLQLAQEELRRKNEELEKRLQRLELRDGNDENLRVGNQTGSQDYLKTTPSKSDSDDFADFEYADNVFDTSLQGLGDDLSTTSRFSNMEIN
ncbi:helix-loop-helix DNA-binding domain-containing protein [Myxozyma melibiosi]|uniref:Helix-loop-helix DNA-binding domain-containing protein n=1 Tax=Myxozyma melibiosi TaxID=54550 RepID=A0ABR1F9A2_9ASCO